MELNMIVKGKLRENFYQKGPQKKPDASEWAPRKYFVIETAYQDLCVQVPDCYIEVHGRIKQLPFQRSSPLRLRELSFVLVPLPFRPGVQLDPGLLLRLFSSSGTGLQNHEHKQIKLQVFNLST